MGSQAGSKTRAESGSSAAGGEQARNEVYVTGRLAADAEPFDLPSGDTLTKWRLVVDRGPSRRRAPEGARETTLDTLDCVAWAPAVQRSVAAWEPGDVIAVEGAVRRRFWRAPSGGVASRYEIEVCKAKRVARAV